MERGNGRLAWMPLVGISPLPGTANGKDDAQLDPVRRRLLRLITDGRTNLHTAWFVIERNASYLQQFI